MRRVVWMGVGAAVTVVVIVRGKRILARYMPAAVVDQAVDSATELTERAEHFVQDFLAEFSRARAAREQELTDALLAEGQDPPAETGFRAARSSFASFRQSDRDDDEDVLGYSF